MENKKILNFRFGEFFCGPGGIALGAKLATATNDNTEFKIQHVWSTDYDEDSCETYRKNICPDRPETVICADVRELNFEMLSDISPIDAFAFGFPCNDFSIVGEQKGVNGKYGPLYMYGINVLKLFRPKWFLAENVGGIRNANDGKAFELILKSMEDVGYKTYPHFYKFEEYGVPQARHRVITIGIRDDLNIPFGIPSSQAFKNINVSALHALENPPIPKDASNNELTKQSATVIERLKHIKPGENAFTAKIPNKLQLRVKGAKISQIYKRLNPDKPSYTVTGSGGGGTHVYHWRENRALTNRERARLQTFPDDFIFCGSKESVRKQIGMAVPPRIAKMILEAVLCSFAKITYPTSNQNIVQSMSLFEGKRQYKSKIQP